MKKILGVALISIIASGCSSFQDIDAQQSGDFVMKKELIENKSFIITEISEEGLSDNLSATIEFKEDRISGRGFCNLFSGSYELNSENLFETSRLLSTKRMCSEDAMKADSVLFRILSEKMSFSSTELGYKITSPSGSFDIMEVVIVDK